MPTTALKNKNQIGSDIIIFPRKEGDAYEWTSEEMNRAMDAYAEQNAIAFSQWRSDISAIVAKRHILNLPIKEQYRLFIKEYGL